MLRRLTFTNFKTWEKAEIEFGQITGLFGTNSSGKTSLIQFLLMLKQTKEATDRALSLELNGNYVKLGLFADAVFGHEEEARTIKWSLSFQMAKELVIVDPAQKRGQTLIRAKSIKVDGVVAAKGGAPLSQELKYTVGNDGKDAPRQVISLFPKGKGDGFDLKAEGTHFRFI